MPVNDLFPGDFQRQDETPDAEFYRQPRLVAHIDDAAIAALGAFVRPLIRDGADVLDMMSAYLTHLPDDVRARCHSVVGLCLSDAEMAANRQLTSHVVHDLNAAPTLPFTDDAFDAALCTVSVQYMMRPEEVFAEVCRVLRPGAPLVVSFSNRCLPTKATRLWLSTDDSQHIALVRLYFERGGHWDGITATDISPHRGRTDPLYVVWARKAAS